MNEYSTQKKIVTGISRNCNETIVKIERGNKTQSTIDEKSLFTRNERHITRFTKEAVRFFHFGVWFVFLTLGEFLSFAKRQHENTLATRSPTTIVATSRINFFLLLLEITLICATLSIAVCAKLTKLRIFLVEKSEEAPIPSQTKTFRKMRQASRVASAARPQIESAQQIRATEQVVKTNEKKRRWSKLTTPTINESTNGTFEESF